MNPSSLDLSSLLNGKDGFLILGKFPSLDPIFGTDQFGFSVSAVRDVNGDGIDDLIVGARQSNVNDKVQAGRSFVIFGDANLGTGGSFDLSTIDGKNGFVVNGENGRDRLGQAVRSAGDFNGDGINDLIIGSFAGNLFEFTNPADGTKSSLFSFGRAYVIFGQAGEFPSNINASDITTNIKYQADNSATVNQDYSKGFSIRSQFGNDVSDSLAGFSVSSAGDIDKDGFDDLIVGVPGPSSGFSKDSTFPGEAWIVYGQNRKPNGSTPLARDRDFYQNLRITFIKGINSLDRTGYSVSGAGDVNGDGTPDILIGARQDAGTKAGESYVVFGKPNIVPDSSSGSVTNSFNLQDLDGSNGFKMTSAGAGERAGWAVRGAGDINGDGNDDLIIGAPSVTNSPTNKPDETTDPTKPGKSYVVFGRKGDFAANLDLSMLNGTNGFVVNGINGGDGAGFSVSSAGDINADGYADLAIGAPFADAGSLSGDAGETYIIYGSPQIGADGSFNLDSLVNSPDGQNGFVLKGTFSGDRSGWSVSQAGDINADGVDDVIIGAVEGQGLPGKSYIVFGNARPQLDLNGRADGIDFETTYRIGKTAVPIVNSDTLTLGDNASDPNKATIKGATVRITNLLNGSAEQLIANTNGTNITSAYNSDTGTLTLSGVDTTAKYQQVLRTLKYQNTAAIPNFENRTLEFVVTDVAAFNTDSQVAKAVVQLLPTSKDVLKLEAENLTLKTYRIEDNAFASGGQLISLRDTSRMTGSASTKFTGKSGDYSIQINYLDETDGKSQLVFQVNGVPVDQWVLDKNLGSRDPIEQTFTQRIIENVALNNGDTLSIAGKANRGEWARIDSIEIIPTHQQTLWEAEDFDLNTYRIENNNAASNGKLISLRNASGTAGIASKLFADRSGFYDLQISYLDETDGVSRLEVKLNDHSIESWALDKKLGSPSPVEQTFVERTIKNVFLKQGDLFSIVGTQNGDEFARVDDVRLVASA